MPGIMILRVDGVILVKTRYETANGRRSILSLYNALYDVQEYTLTIVPDECADTQSAGVSQEKGGAGADIRRHHLHRDVDPHRHVSR